MSYLNPRNLPSRPPRAMTMVEKARHLHRLCQTHRDLFVRKSADSELVRALDETLAREFRLDAIECLEQLARKLAWALPGYRSIPLAD